MTSAPDHLASDLRPVARSVWQWCVARDFAGHDPYDGLKSQLLAPVLTHSRLLRLAVIQGVKRSPWDLRRLLRIPPGHNPKGLALLLHAAAIWPELADADASDRLADAIAGLTSLPHGSPLFDTRIVVPGRAAELQAAAPPAAGWGYDFPWQSKAFLQPAYFPTVVATSFVVDGFAAADHPATTRVTAAAAGLVRDHFHRHEDETGVCYSYSPRDRTRVFNASLFAGKILARAAIQAPAEDARRWREEAARVVDYVVARQRPDGGWIYGEAAHWQWIDNLHTGFVLETIADTAVLLGQPDRWRAPVDRGLAFYRDHLFGPDLTPWYYADRPGRLDPHTVAQAVITFLRFADRDPQLARDARRVLEIGIARLWDRHRNGFIHSHGTGPPQRAIFLRWGQAWMLRALATCIVHEERMA